MSPMYFFVFAATLYCFSDAAVLIRSTKTGLVFDVNGENVRAAKSNNSPGQKWTLEGKQNGHFIIRSVLNNLALDVETGCRTGQNIMVYKTHSKENQQFFINSDGTIGTACGKDLILRINGVNGNVETVKRAQACGVDMHFELVQV